MVAKCALAAALLSLLSLSLPGRTAAKLDGWYKCSEFTFADEITASLTGSKPSGGSQKATAHNAPTADKESASFLTAAECATFQAPLCYDGVCGSTSSDNNTMINIFVKRIVASESPETKPNVWILQGGPGAGSTNMESAMKTLHDMMNGQVNVYTMDHRGTGRSTLLNCVAAQALTSGSPGGSSIANVEIASCADELQGRYNGNLAGFSITSAASDLHNFITTYQKDMRTFVYGVSYGSSVVERLMHLNTTGISGYILDGVSTTSGSAPGKFEYFSTWDVDYNEVGERFTAYCADSKEDCGKYFKESSLPDTLRTLVAQLDAGTAKCSPALATMLSSIVGADTDEVGSYIRILVGKLLSDMSLRNFIAPVIYRIKRCSTEDTKILNHFFSTLAEVLSETTEDDLYSSSLLYKLIVYSELWEIPTPSMTTLTTRFANTTLSGGIMTMLPGYCEFSKDPARACTQYAKYANYKADAIIYKRDKYWNVAAKVPTDKSVLLLSSKLDPQTPQKFAEYLQAAIQAEHKELVTFEYASHGQLWNTPMVKSKATCGMTILASYIKNGGDLSKLDKSCTSNVQPLSLKPKARLVGRLMNTTDAYDGKYDPSAVPQGLDASGSSSSSSSSNSNGFKVGMIILIVACLAVAIVGIVFFLKWRQAHDKAAANVVLVTPVDSSP